MNKKLIFRIIGALSSALIIAGVFVPFVNVTGYTTSLWESFSLTNSIYLPIMIIIFGVIGVIFFALNIKTEFAYMSTGAILFFIVIQTVDIVNQGVFNTLGIGYYFLVIGAVLTGLMAFLTNLKPKKEKINQSSKGVNEPTMINKIDNLYNGQEQSQFKSIPINSLHATSITPLEQNQSVPQAPITPLEQNQVVPQAPITPLEQNQVAPQAPITPLEQNQVVPQAPITPLEQNQSVPQVPITPLEQNQVVPQAPIAPLEQNQSVPQAPIAPLEQNQVVPPVVDSNLNLGVSTGPVNPVVQEFKTANQTSQEFNNNFTNSQPSNPVVQEFMNSNQGQPQNNTGVENNKSGLDIFGQ